MSRAMNEAEKVDAGAGFTLVEVLVSLGVLALILLTVAGAFKPAGRALEAAGDMERQVALAGARAFLEQRLAEAVPVLTRATSGGRGAPGFAGSSDSLTFVAPLPRGPQGAGLYRLTVGVVTGGAGARLVVTAESAGGPASVPATRDELTLVEGVAGLALRYFGSTGPDAKAEWQADWPSQDRLPRLVGISLAFPAADRRSWPELMVEPRLRGPQ